MIATSYFFLSGAGTTQGQEWVRDRRQETIGGGKDFRAGNQRGVRTYGELTTRECVDLLEIRKGWRWEVLCPGWNGAAHTRGHNTCERAERCKRTIIRQVTKGLGMGQAIKIA